VPLSTTMSENNITMTREQLAELAGYSYRQLYNIDKELAEDKKLFVKGEGKKCDLALFVRRWAQYNADKAAGDGKDLEEVKAAHERVKTRKTELEVARLEGSLVEVDDVRRLWEGICHQIMQGMLHLPTTIAPMVLMMDNQEAVTGIIDAEIRKVLRALAESPVPEYAREADGKAEEY